MEDFEAYMHQATARGSNITPGAVVAVVDKNGNFLYQNAFGNTSTAPNAPPITLSSTFFIASCTKLITTIASLQVVERGLITLDTPLNTYLPELASQTILSQSSSGELALRPASKSITLRHLLTHSSGATYDWLSPPLYAWKASRGLPAPTLVADGDVAQMYAYPRTFEAGEGWAYSGGMDWASLLISRLTKQSFGEYVQQNIAQPLGITSWTWRLADKPDVAANLTSITTRNEKGELGEGTTPFWPDPQIEAGGAGMYSSVPDFCKVLADLLKDEPVLLNRASVEEMFTPQFPSSSAPLTALIQAGHEPDSYTCALDASMEGVKPNFGLGSLLLEEDVCRDEYYKPKDTLSWTGLPNLAWSVNREKGKALFFAQQVLPWADRGAMSAVARFEDAVWRGL